MRKIKVTIVLSGIVGLSLVAYFVAMDYLLKGDTD
jgi:hypothetical protein